MNEQVIDLIRSQVVSDIRLAHADGRIRIGTPLMFDDGDHCSFFLVQKDQEWFLTDLGDVITRAGYLEADLLGASYKSRFQKLMEFFGMREDGGELLMPVTSEQVAHSIFLFAQGSLELVRLANLPAERHRRIERQFRHHVTRLIKSVVPADILDENWHDPDLDPEQVYPIDYRIRSANAEWFVLGISTPAKCLHATVSYQHFKLKNRTFRPLPIYRNKEALPRSATAPLDEVTDTLSLSIAEEGEVTTFLGRTVLGGAA